jgi:hypothetical protein
MIINFTKIQRAVQELQTESEEKQVSEAWREAQRELNILQIGAIR